MSDIDYELFLGHFEKGDDLFLNLIDLDRMFARSPDAIILNRIPMDAPDYVQRRNKLIFDRAGSLNFIAHCDCGDLEGNINKGLECSECHTICRDDFGDSKSLEHNVWLSIPNSIPGVLHPVAYIVLSTWLSRKGGLNYIDDIIDPTVELPPELADVVTGRGQKYFYENFDRLMEYFINHYRYVDKKSKPKRDNAVFIEQFIVNYRKVLFCTKLPVMSSVLNSITSSDGVSDGRRQYADAILSTILDAATDLQQVEETTIRTRPNAVPGILHRIYKSYISYVTDIARDRLSRKESLVRKHVLGTRMHLSFRAVIIPHTDRYEDLYFPWGITVNLLKLHIIGRLVRNHSMSIGDAISRIMIALINYDELIDQIMNDLIAECRPEFPGLPVLFLRNPSLRRGSMSLYYVTKIKKQLSDMTISISPLSIKASNADFDGDAMMGVLIVEMDAARAFRVLHQSMRIRSITRTISDDMSLSKQSIVVLNNMLQTV